MAKIYNDTVVWTLKKREIRQVVFTQDPATGVLSAVAYHQYLYEDGDGNQSWEQGPVIELQQNDLLNCHASAPAVLEAIKTLFHNAADTIDNL